MVPGVVSGPRAACDRGGLFTWRKDEHRFHKSDMTRKAYGYGNIGLWIV